MLSKKRLLNKWYCVILRNACSTLSTTSDKARQIIGWTLVCVSIHLECWLNKARAEIVTWAAVGVVCPQQFSYNSVSKFWQCEHDWCGLNSHSMHIGWMRTRIQTGLRVKRLLNASPPTHTLTLSSSGCSLNITIEKRNTNAGAVEKRAVTSVQGYTEQCSWVHVIGGYPYQCEQHSGGEEGEGWAACWGKQLHTMSGRRVVVRER